MDIPQLAAREEEAFRELRAARAQRKQANEPKEEKLQLYPRNCPHCSKSFPSSTRYHKHVSYHTAA
ncbi:unnamed protein product, partial [Symbiodinium pilosum]